MQKGKKDMAHVEQTWHDLAIYYSLSVVRGTNCMPKTLQEKGKKRKMIAVWSVKLFKNLGEGLSNLK
jgi:hypothetical protein